MQTDKGGEEVVISEEMIDAVEDARRRRRDEGFSSGAKNPAQAERALIADDLRAALEAGSQEGTVTVFGPDQTYESAFTVITTAIHAMNPGQSITVERHHFDRHEKWFTVTTRPYETQVQATQQTPSVSLESEQWCPLDVAWVCAACHGRRHRLEAETPR